MPVLVFAAEKTKEVEVSKVSELLQAAREGEPGWQTALIVFGERAYPLIDPGERWGELSIAYALSPLLGRSPDLVEAIREIGELAATSEEPLATIFITSLAVRPSRDAEGALGYLERAGIKYRIVLLRPSPPGWVKHFPRLSASLIAYRNNMNMEKLYKRLVEELKQVP